MLNLLVVFSSVIVILVGVVRPQPPMIDLSPLASLTFIDNYLSDPAAENAAEAMFKQIEEAMRIHGVFIAVNIAEWFLSEIEVTHAFNSAWDLFNLPASVKRSVKMNASHRFNRGYLSFGAESGLVDKFEPKEGYSYGHPMNGGSYQNNFVEKYTWLHAPNIWPDGFNPDDLSLVYIRLSKLAEVFLEFIAKRRGQHNKSTAYNLEGGSEISLLRLFHYYNPKTATSLLNTYQNQSGFNETMRLSQVGSSPHTDWGLLTIIMQDQTPGLQYLFQGQWVDVPYIQDSLIFNVGDYFSAAVEGDYHAPVHRVLCPTGEQDRLSFVYFHYPSYQSPMLLKATDPQGSNKTESREQSCGSDRCNENTVANDGIIYNTLNRLDEEVQMASVNKILMTNESFGDYILKKWKGVYRKERIDANE